LAVAAASEASLCTLSMSLLNSLVASLDCIDIPLVVKERMYPSARAERSAAPADGLDKRKSDAVRISRGRI
jgi:hypothetical protein